MIRPRLENPITIVIKDEDVFFREEGKEDLLITKGIVFGGESYGFYIIMDTYNGQLILPYPTQCRIYGVDHKYGSINLSIYEDGKKLPWKFNISSGITCEEVAQFLDVSRPDIRFLKDNYGIEGLKQLEKVNRYARKVVLKK